MASDAHMVIVGAGLAGARASAELREAGFDGPITLIAGEPHAPYDRPPLSKAVLLKEKSPDDCALFGETFFADHAIDLRLAASAVEIDRAARKVLLDNGERIGYSRLLIATGASPRMLSVPGSDLPGVVTLRTVDDARDLATRLHHGQRVAIIGGGFIGLEVAASAVAAGCSVTVIEAGQRLLMRAVPQEIAARIEARHRDAGVQFRFEAQLTAIAGAGAAEEIRLADGEVIRCDTVVVGIGAAPRTALAQAAGLGVTDGIVVDDHLCTSDPGIFAAGDACSFPHPLYGCRVRLECWKNAEDQGRVAARNMLGESLRYREVPWFWSDQYELSIQIAGLPAFGCETVVRETADALLLFHLSADGSLIAASGVGRAVGRDIRIAQMLIGRSARLSAEDLADPTVKLKSLLVAEAV
ncbi:pyridine nucleotide-disulfide oxidoreductase [Paraburkholderia madseniana]|uniref:Pyridine nucleotide-disulfide oxidoreductase n=1 Tax=Paraburkholderia madseniana TaxID=2599607 RepID=A0A6N6WHH4_9BURK|nr:FAD-dependent oxidoreductase [Paraburkholderia madseniana]KAE8760115.1 pyridine nucleotide-disulfide oxidoreductase [Paraburkholderia madseniana]